MELKCTHNFDQAPEIERGRMSYCRNAVSWHWFIMVESGSYQRGVFYPDDKIRVAFSYVPNRTFEYINDKYDGKQDFEFFIDKRDSNLDTLSGYNLFLFTQSHVIDTWKLTDQFVRQKSRRIKDWRFHRRPEYNRYNILSVIPFSVGCGKITDCIGYSNIHYKHELYCDK